MDTIFGKVDVTTGFLSDLTFVGARDGGRRTPNPNVLMKHGWALKTLTWRESISVMNTAFGHPEQYPLLFDLQHFARPILFKCPADSDKETGAAEPISASDNLLIRCPCRRTISDAISSMRAWTGDGAVILKPPSTLWPHTARARTGLRSGALGSEVRMSLPALAGDSRPASADRPDVRRSR